MEANFNAFSYFIINYLFYYIFIEPVIRVTSFFSFCTGGGVVTTRAHVHYIVTEYGIAYLFGKNLRQRAYELIKIAHPDHREWLEKAAFDRLKCIPSPD